MLAGGSGSGKSTLLRAAAGLVPHFHGGEFAGRLLAGGLDSRDHGPAELSAVAGSLFQDPETQVVMGTVRAELAFPLENRGWGAAAVARGVEEAALALGVAGLLDRSTHELSGGELQRVALGAALAARPRLLLLDEPTSQLDPVAGDELLGVLRRVNEEWGTAVVLAEHRLERCLAAADRVIALDHGAVTIDADPRGFLEQAPDALQTPGARLFRAAGLTPPPVAVKDARAALRARGWRACRRTRASRSPAAAERRAPAAAPPLAPGDRARVRAGLVRDPARACGAARGGRGAGAGRARGADGAQRGGQVDAAAARGRAGRADARAHRRAPGGSRCCSSTPATTWSRSAWGRSFRPRRSRRPASARSPTATRATSPAASASGSRWRSCCRASLRPPSCSTSRRAAWTAATRRRSRTACASWPRRAPPCSWPPTTPSSPRPGPTAPSCSATAPRSPTPPTTEVLGGGWYFATQTARILGGRRAAAGGRRRAAAREPGASAGEEVAP